jgi:hypothetical protein
MTNHLNDGQLFQLLDGPGEHGDTDIRIHADSCAECGSRLIALQKRSRRFSELLRRTDEAVPTLVLPGSPRIGRRVAIAATLSLLVGGSLFVQPVRAWILAQGLSMWHRVSTDAGSVEPVAAATASEDYSGAGVSFAPRRSTLTIDVMIHQASGSVTVRRTEGAEVTANVIDAGEADGIAVLPDGFRIENSEQSVAAYDVAIPSTIEVVEIIVEGKVVTRFQTGGTQFSGRTVDLTSEPGTQRQK